MHIICKYAYGKLENRHAVGCRPEAIKLFRSFLDCASVCLSVQQLMVLQQYISFASSAGPPVSAHQLIYYYSTPGVASCIGFRPSARYA